MSHDYIVFFDGYCNLCNRSVDFLIRHDKQKKLHFASQQSEFAKRFFHYNAFDTRGIDSFIFYDKGNFYIRSAAFFRIMRLFGFPYRLLNVFLIIPRFFRDWIYNLISKRRYDWFGKSSTCRIPTESEKTFFIE